MKKQFLILAWVIIIALTQSGLSQTSDLQAFLSGKKTKYFTEGHPKAKGINISIEYPSHWQRFEGERPNIVQTLKSDASDGLIRMCIISIKDQPSFMKLFSSEHISDAMFSQEALKEIVPEGATFIKGERTKYEGQPGAWIIYVRQAERAGIRVESYILMHMFLYSGKLIGMECSVSALANSGAQVEQEFTRYVPLFHLIGNSIIIHDKWKKTIGLTDILSEKYGEYWIINLIFSAIFTWGIGLAPPLISRFAILRRPMSKIPAIVFVAIFWFLNLMFFTALGSQSKTHGGLFFVAIASYYILRAGWKKYQINVQSQSQHEHIWGVSREQMRQDQNKVQSHAIPKTGSEKNGQEQTEHTNETDSSKRGR